ncbi:MAG: hypothetical protein NZM00_11125 [Anaerolinea sp.]|nr:hypothetical protein [Anaerolinea sp.]
MIAGLGAAKNGVVHVIGHLHAYVIVNILWLLFTLPIITAPAAWAGLCRFSYYALRRPTTDIGDFWAGLRANLVRGIPVGLAGLLIALASVSNLISYPAHTNPWISLFRPVWIGMPLIWFAMQLYAFPIMYAQIEPGLLRAYRNAGTMILLNPFFTLGVWLAAAIITGVSILLPFAWVLVTGALLAGIGNYAVLDRLRAAGFAPPMSASAVDEGGTLADFEGYT